MPTNGTLISEPLVNSYVVGVNYDAPNVANITGATAGTPGTWTPAGGELRPGNSADANHRGIVANPATPWTAGQYVQGSLAGAPGEMTWTGTQWVGGRAPATLELDVAGSTVAHVQGWVDDHPEFADEVLAVEQARGTSARVTLVDWLSGFIAHRDED